uniref:Ig-like domain-containing protein n=1 Tax=Leptobrachium leishanense TaxID=445787 RepID=A0A8C5MN06_9ANUR
MRRHNPLRAIFSIFLLQYQAHLDSAQNVMASVGDMATLFCTYSASEGTASMCWGRGVCPISKCNDVIIWTDGIKVTTKPSEKYQLFGDIEKGNVSLTINRVTYSDEGTYCCRVEIPGIFNDIKKEITVRIQEDEDEPVLVAAVYKPDTAPFKKLITTIKPKNTDSTQQLLSPGTHHKIEASTEIYMDNHQDLIMIIVKSILLFSLLPLFLLVLHFKARVKRMHSVWTVRPCTTDALSG